MCKWDNGSLSPSTAHTHAIARLSYKPQLNYILLATTATGTSTRGCLLPLDGSNDDWIVLILCCFACMLESKCCSKTHHIALSRGYRVGWWLLNLWQSAMTISLLASLCTPSHNLCSTTVWYVEFYNKFWLVVMIKTQFTSSVTGSS